MSFFGQEGRVLIQADGPGRFVFVGASTWSNVEPSPVWLNSIAVGAPETGKVGVVAVILTPNANIKSTFEYPFLLSVRIENGKVIIDKSFELVPPIGMKVRHTRESLDVTINDEKFTTSSFKNTEGYRKVDGNTLCWYMANPCKETADAVRVAAGELEQKKTLEEELKQTKVDLEAALARVQELGEADIRNEDETWLLHKSYRHTVNFQEQTLHELGQLIDEGGDIACRKWYQRKMNDIRQCGQKMHELIWAYRDAKRDGKLN